MKKIRSFISQFSFFYIILYLVLMITVFYSPFIDTFFVMNNTQDLFEVDVQLYKDNLLEFLLGNELLVDDGFYSQREYHHMQDVLFLFTLANYFFFFFTIAFLFTHRTFSFFFYAKNVFFVILFFLIASGLFFSQLFLLFHELVFTNDLWLLPADSSLIKMFPESFFAQIVSLISIVLLGVHGTLLLISKLHDRFTQK